MSSHLSRQTFLKISLFSVPVPPAVLAGQSRKAFHGLAVMLWENVRDG
ncbi:MAG: hypothetical protein ORN52_07050 [Beijerinckiaceae bacterium]|jgi:hypothetical protein|nr:hypothetical protein [Beijerinckiaceae bacterium]